MDIESKTEMVKEMQEAQEKYGPSNWHGKDAFHFPRGEIKDKACLDAAFGLYGLKVAEVQYECFGMWVWVMTQDGDLWLNDFSHGGGGVFVKEPSKSKTQLIKKAA